MTPCLVPLTKGLVALVDEQDLPRVGVRKWQAVLLSGKWYASGGCRDKAAFLHRFILGLPKGVGEVDHKNGDGLDCTRGNLRVCTHRQNQFNMRTPSNNTSGFRGVCLHRKSGAWQAATSYKGKAVYLGSYKTPEDAARSYDDFARATYGEFARLNFPLAGEQQA